MAFDYISDYENFNFTYCIKLFHSCDGLLFIVDLSGKMVIWNPSTVGNNINRAHFKLKYKWDPHVIYDGSEC